MYLCVCLIMFSSNEQYIESKKDTSDINDLGLNDLNLAI